MEKKMRKKNKRNCPKLKSQNLTIKTYSYEQKTLDICPARHRAGCGLQLMRERPERRRLSRKIRHCARPQPQGKPA